MNELQKSLNAIQKKVEELALAHKANLPFRSPQFKHAKDEAEGLRAMLKEQATYIVEVLDVLEKSVKDRAEELEETMKIGEELAKALKDSQERLGVYEEDVPLISKILEGMDEREPELKPKEKEPAPADA